MSESHKPPALPYAVFCGLDVGNADHHACALAPDGTKLHDKALPNDETALREVFTRLSLLGPVLVIVDQPASIGALRAGPRPRPGCRRPRTHLARPGPRQARHPAHRRTTYSSLMSSRHHLTRPQG